jgi:hypothetical protein
VLSGNLINGGAVISCPHGGRASAASALTGVHGVRLDGLPVPGGTDVFIVSGCPHTVDGVPHPCTTIRWSPASDSVLIDGVPVLLDTTHAQCFTAGLIPQGPPLVSAVQQGVVCR